MWGGTPVWGTKEQHITLFIYGACGSVDTAVGLQGRESSTRVATWRKRHREQGFEGGISAGVGERAAAGTPQKKMWGKASRQVLNDAVGGEGGEV